MHLCAFLDGHVYSGPIAQFSSITASRIHILSGGNPPMSHRVFALNSFVLPAHEVDVSHAPMLGLCLYGIYST